MRINSLAPIVLALSLVHGSGAFDSAAKKGIDKREPALKGTKKAASDKSSHRSLKGGKCEEGDEGCVWGTIPPRSERKGKVGEIPEQNKDSAVKISTSTKLLTYVESIDNIEDGPVSGMEVVDAWVLENEYIKIKGVLLGGNLMGFEDKETGEEYLWLNQGETTGAVGYAANSNAFPLTRGLFLHGGIRMAAVTAEHGLYYDTEWDIDFRVTQSGNKGSMIFSIKDDKKARELLNDPLSTGGFSSWLPDPMSNYPITDAKFIFKVTLRKGEKFLRTECIVDNTRDTAIAAEAWMPQTWPVTKDSQIISHQKKRRVKAGSGAYVSDAWVMNDLINGKFVASEMMLDNERGLPAYDGTAPYLTPFQREVKADKPGYKNGWIVGFPPSPYAGVPPDVDAKQAPNLDKPLSWPSPSGGIMYDYPMMDGNYHAVSFGDGRGVAYVAPESTTESPHFTKMWSWGDPDVYNRTAAALLDPPLAAGRPKEEYYEPWASAFNTAFFELYQFPPGRSSWEARFVLIGEGLDADKNQLELREVVDQAVEDAVKSFE